MRVVISCHFDTVFGPNASMEIFNGVADGATDNIAGLLAVAQLIGEPDLEIQFTEDEEMHMDGARYVAREHSADDTAFQVVDVTDSVKPGKKYSFTVENYAGIQEKHIRKALAGFRFKIVKEGTESEAWLYKELGFTVIEVDIPVSGGIHNLHGGARVEDILVVGKSLKALADYIRPMTRAQLSDYQKVEV